MKPRLLLMFLLAFLPPSLWFACAEDSEESVANLLISAAEIIVPNDDNERTFSVWNLGERTVVVAVESEEFDVSPETFTLAPNGKATIHVIVHQRRDGVILVKSGEHVLGVVAVKMADTHEVDLAEFNKFLHELPLVWNEVMQDLWAFSDNAGENWALHVRFAIEHRSPTLVEAWSGPYRLKKTDEGVVAEITFLFKDQWLLPEDAELPKKYHDVMPRLLVRTFRTASVPLRRIKDSLYIWDRRYDPI